MSSSGIANIPPPLFRAPFVQDKEGNQYFLTSPAQGFLQQLWNGLAGSGGVIPSIISIPIPVTGSVTAYNAVTVNSSGQAAAPDITVIADGLGLAGVATSSGSTGTTVTIQCLGTVTNSAWTWTPGGAIWCGAGGVLTQTAPSAAGDWVGRVGTALSATTMLIELGELVELT